MLLHKATDDKLEDNNNEHMHQTWHWVFSRDGNQCPDVGRKHVEVWEISMRQSSGILGVAMAAFVAPAFTPSWAAAADTMRMTIPVVSSSFAPYLIALGKGYYAEDGLDVQRINAQGGVATAALLSGGVEVSTSSSSALSAIMRGAPFKIVYTMMDRPDYQLWTTLPELKTLQDLKGKNVGVQTRGDTYEIAMRLTLQAAGLPVDWVGYTAVGMGAATRAALQSGSLPAIMIAKEDLDELSGSAVLQRGHLIVNTFDTIRMPYTGAVVSDKLLAANPAEVERFLHATLKGLRYMRAFRDGTNAILKTSGAALDDRTLVTDYNDVVETLTVTGVEPDDVLRHDMNARAALLNIPMDKVPPVDKAYDYRLVRQANAELDQAGWKPVQ
jgi:NitT/TauT family transport system substrate-binding protein